MPRIKAANKAGENTNKAGLRGSIHVQRVARSKSAAKPYQNHGGSESCCISSGALRQPAGANVAQRRSPHLPHGHLPAQVTDRGINPASIRTIFCWAAADRELLGFPGRLRGCDWQRVLQNAVAPF